PSVSETAAIQDFIRNTDAEIGSKERNIVALQASIDQLVCEVAELRRCSDQHKAIIAPIRRVPHEVMAEIFMQLAEIEEENGRQAPLIFGEISREWRTIALSLPRLW
ncbi:hypothetical protein C8R44DRAFT_546078, partial [Mycena epipterygia]